MPAFGLTCTTQSQMSADQRNALRLAAMAVAGHVQSGDANAVKEQTISAVAEKFDGIAASIEAVDPAIQHATLTLSELYLLDASDLKSAQEAEFFCGLPASTLTVEITIPNLPPGKYALAVVHATGVKNPQALSMVMENDPAGSSTWKMAGFFTRPMTMGGHDGVWFWQQARDYAAKKQNWNAYFYFRDGGVSAGSGRFYLQSEPGKAGEGDRGNEAGWIAGRRASAFERCRPDVQCDESAHRRAFRSVGSDCELSGDGESGSGGCTGTGHGSDARGAGPQHPELKTAFHGLWIYATPPDNQHPFALELPIDQIEVSVPPAGQQK